MTASNKTGNRKASNLIRSTALAALLLVLPVGQAGPAGWLGPEPAEAASCKWRVEVCSEIDLVVWKGTVCFEYCHD
ncbi:MAG: hypothetical protein ACREMD_12715 [Gemmatimonadota bacterium]